MNLLLPGMYVAADSPLHHLDPRVKMGAALGLMALPFAVHTLLGSLLLAALLAATAWLARAPTLPLLRTVRTVFWLALLMFVFYFFTTPGQPLVTWMGISVTAEGLAMGATQVYRICLLVIVASLLTYTTSPAQLAHGLEALLGPLERARFPVRDDSPGTDHRSALCADLLCRDRDDLEGPAGARGRLLLGRTPAAAAQPGAGIRTDLCVCFAPR